MVHSTSSGAAGVFTLKNSFTFLKGVPFGVENLAYKFGPCTVLNLHIYSPHSVLVPCEVGLCFSSFCTHGNGGTESPSDLSKVAQQGSGGVGRGTQAA